MDFIRNVLLGLLIGLMVGFWMGLNTGKQRPLFANPFEEEKVVESSALDKLKDGTSQLIDDGRDALRNAVK